MKSKNKFFSAAAIAVLWAGPLALAEDGSDRKCVENSSDRISTNLDHHWFKTTVCFEGNDVFSLTVFHKKLGLLLPITEQTITITQAEADKCGASLGEKNLSLGDRKHHPYQPGWEEVSVSGIDHMEWLIDSMEKIKKGECGVKLHQIRPEPSPQAAR